MANEAIALESGLKLNKIDGDSHILLTSETEGEAEFTFSKQKQQYVWIGGKWELSYEHLMRIPEIVRMENMLRENCPGHSVAPQKQTVFVAPWFQQKKKILLIAAIAIALLIIILAIALGGKKNSLPSQGMRPDGSFHFDNRNGGTTEVTFGSDGSTTVKQYK